MSLVVNKWRVYCITDNKWVYWYLHDVSPAPTTCSDDTQHTVNPNSISIIETISPDSIELRNNGSIDGYGRLRVSNQRILLNFKQLYSVGNLKFVSRTTGSATVTYDSNDITTSLTCTTNSSDSAVYQLRDYIVYQAGSSNVIISTGILGEQKTNVNTYIGYYDDFNGMYFTMNGTQGLCIGYRSNATGSIVDTLVTRSSWDGDKLDGIAPSKLNMDLSKTQLWYIDFQWQGTGRVRWGIFSKGEVVIVHTVNFNNIMTSPYTANPNLPPRIEIKNTGTTVSNTSIKLICVAASIESTTDPSGLTFSKFSTSAPTPSAGILTPILSLRLRTVFEGKQNRMKIVIKNAQFSSSSGSTLYSYNVIWNGTLSGAVWSNVNTNNSGMEFDQTAVSVSNGIIIESGFFNTNNLNKIESNYLDFNTYPLGLDVNGANPINLTLAVTRLSGQSSSVFASVTWSEIY